MYLHPPNPPPRQVAALHTLRVGGVDALGQEVPAPATALGESPELSTRRAQEQADDLAGEKTGRALAPGALAWHLLITDLAPGGASPFQLCGRPGWHTSHMMHRLELEVLMHPNTNPNQGPAHPNPNPNPTLTLTLGLTLTITQTRCRRSRRPPMTSFCRVQRTLATMASRSARRVCRPRCSCARQRL